MRCVFVCVCCVSVLFVRCVVCTQANLRQECNGLFVPVSPNSIIKHHPKQYSQTSSSIVKHNSAAGATHKRSKSQDNSWWEWCGLFSSIVFVGSSGELDRLSWMSTQWHRPLIAWRPIYAQTHEQKHFGTHTCGALIFAVAVVVVVSGRAGRDIQDRLDLTGSSHGAGNSDRGG